MATRSPTLQTNNQYHRNWGNYTDPSLVPNGSAAALPDPEFSKLEIGDLCYVEGGGAGVIGVYYCSAVGTVGGADTTWNLLAAGATVTQSVRDSAAIVVALSAAPYSNQILIDADVLDAGDGAGLAQALSNATAKIVSGFTGADLKLRAGGYVLDDAAIVGAGFSLPLVLTANVRVLGSGREVTQITGGDGTGATTQEMFDLNGRSELKDVKLISPTPAAAPAAGDRGVLLVTAGATPVTVRDILIDVQGAGATARTTGIAIKALAPISDDLIVDAVDITLYNSDTDARAVGVSIGEPTTASSPNVEPLVRDVSVTGGKTSVEFLSVSGGRAQGIIFTATEPNTEGVIWDHSVAAGAGLAWNGPQIMDVKLTMGSNVAAATGAATGIRLTDGGGSIIAGTQIHNVYVRWPVDNSTGALTRTTLLMEAALAGSNWVLTMIHGILTVGLPGIANAYEQGVHLDASVAGGGINGVSLSDCQADFAATRGAFLDTGGGITFGNISNVRIHGCEFKSLINGVSLFIDANCADTIAVGNHLGAGLATGLTDNGTGTDAAHNIFV